MRIGVDFGGTKIEAAALDPDGTIRLRRRRANPGAYEAALRTVCELITELETEAGVEGTVGIGAPGSPSPRDGLMRNCNTVWLNGRPLREDLERALKRPVRLANDANCLALSEAVDGAAAGAHCVFGVILGTGCGGAVVVNGRLLEGANGIAGEWGHAPLPWARHEELPGPPCWCGQRGCVETWVSGPALARDHALRHGGEWSAEAVVSDARRGEEHAAATLERYVGRLGRALAVICNVVDPDVFVFGGGLSQIGELYGQLPSAIAPFVFADRWSARLVPARWGDSSGVRGAARLWE